MKWLIAVLALAGAQAQEEKKEEGLPLEVAETLEFTVDEVTWMSLDVSPGGTTLVFDLLGDLYTLPVTGGEATRIVGGMSFESQPRYSRRHDDRLFERSQRGREPVDRGRGWRQSPRGGQGQTHQIKAAAHGLAGVDR